MVQEVSPAEVMLVVVVLEGDKVAGRPQRFAEGVDTGGGTVRLPTSRAGIGHQWASQSVDLRVSARCWLWRWLRAWEFASWRALHRR